MIITSFITTAGKKILRRERNEKIIVEVVRVKIILEELKNNPGKRKIKKKKIG